MTISRNRMKCRFSLIISFSSVHYHVFSTSNLLHAHRQGWVEFTKRKTTKIFAKLSTFHTLKINFELFFSCSNEKAIPNIRFIATKMDRCSRLISADWIKPCTIVSLLPKHNLRNLRMFSFFPSQLGKHTLKTNLIQ